MSTLPADLAHRIGADQFEPTGIEADPLPETMLDWAIRWAAQGLHLFPCKSFLGIPIPDKWYREATPEIARLVEWWSATPDADIAAVPELSGHFVIRAAGEIGQDSLYELEDKYGDLAPVFTIYTRWGDTHLWFPGRALTSHHKLGPGLHVLGPGTFVYMPASLAPDAD